MNWRTKQAEDPFAQPYLEIDGIDLERAENVESEVFEEEYDYEEEEEFEESEQDLVAAADSQGPHSRISLGEPPAQAPTNTIHTKVLSEVTRKLFRTDEDIRREPDRYPVDEAVCATLSPEDQDFVYNTKELFDQIDDVLLSDTFIPHEHVIGIIASPDGRNSSPSEIEEKLAAYRDLEEEICLDLEDYIAVHQSEFNNAVRHFSEMILAVSGSENEAERLKEELLSSATGLESHAEQLSLLRQRAVKAYYMAEFMRDISEAIHAEKQVRQLIKSRQYYAAVLLLRQHRQVLHGPFIRQIHATDRLRTAVENVLQTLHAHIIDNLLSCVFCEEVLTESSGSSRGTSNALFAPQAKKREDFEDYDADWEMLLLSTDRFRESGQEVSLKHYTKVIPLSIQSLLLLGKLPEFLQAYFSRASQTIEDFITEFVRQYGAWRCETILDPLALPGGGEPSTTVLESSSVRAIRRSAYEWESDIISTEESLALVQSPHLQLFFTLLFGQLLNIVRNAAFVQAVVLVAHFPFLAPFIDPNTGRTDVPRTLNVAQTRALWDISSAPISDPSILDTVLRLSFEDVERQNVAQPASPPSRYTKKAFGPPTLAVEEAAVNAPSSPQGKSKARRDEKEYALAAVSALRDFFKRNDIVKKYFPSWAPPDPAKGEKEKRAASDPLAPSQSYSFSSGKLTLRELINYLDKLPPQLLAEYPHLRPPQVYAVTESLTSAVSQHTRDIFEDAVRQLLRTWNIQPLWTQIQYHMERLCRILCGIKENDGDLSGAVRRSTGVESKKQTTVQRSKRQAAIERLVERDRTSEEYHSLSAVLSNVHSVTGLTRMMVDTGPVVFKMTQAVKTLQQRRQWEAKDSRQERHPPAVGGAEGFSAATAAARPSLMKHIDALRQWFVLTPMNVLVCYEASKSFVQTCLQRVPSLQTSKTQEAGLLSFLSYVFRRRYITALQAFHSRQLHRRFLGMDDAREPHGPAAPPPPSSFPAAAKGESEEKQACSVLDGDTDDAPAKPAAFLHPTNVSSWPIIGAPGSRYPILSCVHYVSRVVDKLSRLRNALPLRDELLRVVLFSMLADVTDFLRQKLTELTRGTIHTRLLGRSFEAAYRGGLDARWSALCNDEVPQETHALIDKDLYVYYQGFNAQRTSGHEYNSSQDVSAPHEPLTALSVGDDETGVDSELGKIAPAELGLADESVVVLLAVLCSSTEWLADFLRDTPFDSAATTSATSHAAESGEHVTIPGGPWEQLLTLFHPGRGGRSKSSPSSDPLSGFLVRLYSIAQASLFHLSIEARWLAFCYLPQLRDESYNAVAASSAADNFIQAYVRRISSFYSVLRQHLPERKLLYTCLTAARPASELVLLELAHLRDKAISSSGLAKLRTNLLVIQTAWQLVLPASVELREAITKTFMRPLIFLRYVNNTDVVADLLFTGDHTRFSEKEIEVLIRLVFRQVSGANSDALAVKYLNLYRQKLHSTPSPTLPSHTEDGLANAQRWRTPSTSETEPDDPVEEEEEEYEEASSEHSVRGSPTPVPQYVDPVEPPAPTRSRSLPKPVSLEKEAIEACEEEEEEGDYEYVEVTDSGADEESEYEEEEEQE